MIGRIALTALIFIAAAKTLSYPGRSDVNAAAYYEPPVANVSMTPMASAGNTKSIALSYARTQEARDLIRSLSPEFFEELKPNAALLVHKLQSEGNTLEYSKYGAAVLISFVSQECVGLSKEGRRDFAQAIVEASI